MKALGLIEVDGYLTAIIASDAALKSANVTLIGIEAVKSGISCLKITGDVDAVKAAVEAGEKAAKDKGLLRRAHVIPRLHEDTANLLLSEVFINVENNNEAKIIDYDIAQQEDEILDTIDEFQDKIIDTTNDIQYKYKIVDSIDEELQTEEKLDNKLNYTNMKVDQLKNYVKKLKIDNLTNKQIKLMKKVQLINILDDYFKESEEGE